MCLQWLSWLRYHNESDFICYFERFCMFSKGSVGVEILIPGGGGLGGRTKKNFQARYRSPWPPSPLRHTFNFYPGLNPTLTRSSDHFYRRLTSLVYPKCLELSWSLLLLEFSANRRLKKKQQPEDIKKFREKNLPFGHSSCVLQTDGKRSQ